MNHKFYYCYRCTFSCNSQVKYYKHESSHSFVPDIVCHKKKITSINEHSRQNVKNIITVDVECCVVDVTNKNCKYVIAEHIPISVGYIWQNNFKYYFGHDWIKRLAREILEIETEKSFKRKEKMIFNKADKIYPETNNTCHICGKTIY